MANHSVSEFMKEGSKYLTGLEEAILRNVEASKKLSDITRSSLGPNGMNKMVINKLDKLFVTSDAVTIMNELNVAHPAAKMIVLAAQMQEKEMGDGTNLVVILAGELLHLAESLLRTGIHPADVVRGYEKAAEAALRVLDELPKFNVDDVRDVAAVGAVLRAAVASKQYGYEDVLSPVIAQACVQVCPDEQAHFNVDNVRTVKIAGGGVGDLFVVSGMVLTREPEGSVRHANDAKVAVYAAGFDAEKTETKGTVLLHNAEELLNFSKGEEALLEKAVAALAELGVTVVISGNAVGSMALHFLNKYNIMCVKAPSKFELRRLCSVTGAQPLVRFDTPQPEDIGTCSRVYVREIGSVVTTVFDNDTAVSRVATIVVRGSTQNILDDVERAVDDAVNVYRTVCRDPLCVAGAGAAEMEIARQLAAQAEKTTDLSQYAMKRFAQAFEVIPRTLGETCGMDPIELIATLHASKYPTGVNVAEAEVGDALEMKVLDCLSIKRNAIQQAADVACLILSVDQLVMARPAGLAPRQMGPRDAD